MRSRDAVLSAEDLLEQVWDEHADPSTNTALVTISRLRRKLGDPRWWRLSRTSATGSGPTTPDLARDEETFQRQRASSRVTFGPVPLTERAGSPQLRLAGEIDMAIADQLRAAGRRVVERLGEGCRIDVDVSKVTFLDSSGLGALVYIRRLAREAGGSVELLGASPSVARLLELAGLRDLFVHPGRPEGAL